MTPLPSALPSVDLDALEKAALAATPGPWTSERQDEDSGSIYFAIHAHDQYEFITNISDGRARTNAKFIAAANPQTVLQLIRDVKRLAEALEETDSMLAATVTQLRSWDHEPVINDTRRHERNKEALSSTGMGGE